MEKGGMIRRLLTGALIFAIFLETGFFTALFAFLVAITFELEVTLLKHLIK